MLNYSPSNFPFEATAAEFDQDYFRELSIFRNGADTQSEEEATFVTEHQQMALQAFQHSMPSLNTPLSVIEI
jgi:hypothetical protein